MFASDEHGEGKEAHWPIGLSVVTLLVVTVLVALVSEIFVESVQKAAETFGMSPAYMRSEVRGLSTFEFQLAITAALRAGDAVRVQSALAHVGNSSLRLFHRMLNARSGEPLGSPCFR